MSTHFDAPCAEGGRCAIAPERSLRATLFRVWALQERMPARDGSDEPAGPDQGHSPELDFRGKKRSNATQVSRTDPSRCWPARATGWRFRAIPRVPRPRTGMG